MSTVALHHILVKSEWLAADLMRELALGADFADLAAEYSSCPSGQRQGYAGQHDTDLLPSALVQALFNSENTGPYLGPVKTKFGFHILKAVEKSQRSVLLDNHSL